MKIIAFDPGLERLGIAILEKRKGKKEKLIFSECFKTSKSLPFPQRLLLIGNRIKSLIKKYKPKATIIEKIFFTTNQKTALNVSNVYGIILYESAINGLKIFEFTPLEVKLAITGYGYAEKNQIKKIMEHLIECDFKKNKMLDDEIDAIAVGLTFFAYKRL